LDGIEEDAIAGARRPCRRGSWRLLLRLRLRRLRRVLEVNCILSLKPHIVCSVGKKIPEITKQVRRKKLEKTKLVVAAG
jgi:hypothetical protein